jgi:hypothetical protein
MEIWLPINKNYDVSCLGNVRNSRTLKILKSWNTGIGYKKIQVGPNRERYRVHRLVCEAFCANPNENMYVDHINGIRDDNRAINLRWCSQKQNMEYAKLIL